MYFGQSSEIFADSEVDHASIHGQQQAALQQLGDRCLDLAEAGLETQQLGDKERHLFTKGRRVTGQDHGTLDPVQAMPHVDGAAARVQDVNFLAHLG